MSYLTCTKCGDCCRVCSCGLEDGKDGTFEDSVEGVCKYLGEDNLCSIYDSLLGRQNKKGYILFGTGCGLKLTNLTLKALCRIFLVDSQGRELEDQSI